MGRIAENPKTHVLSFRVNGTEWKLLQKASRKTGVDVSTLLRQGLIKVLKDDRA
jgi:Ribbon-helix-helix domain